MNNDHDLNLHIASWLNCRAGFATADIWKVLITIHEKQSGTR